MSAPLTPQVEEMIAAHERLAAANTDVPPAARHIMRGNLDVLAALLRMSAALRDGGMSPEDVGEAIEAAVGGAFAMFCLHIQYQPSAALDDVSSLLNGIFDVASEHLESAAPMRAGRLN